jgi:hypothetical protein
MEKHIIKRQNLTEKIIPFTDDDKNIPELVQDDKIIDIIPDPNIFITKSKTKQIRNDNGNILARYKNIPTNIKFKHKAVNDANQHLCGGWTVGKYKKYEEFRRVEQEFKPLGLCHTDSLEEAEKMKKVYTKKGLLFSIHKNEFIENTYDIILSVNATFGEYFDMDTLIEDYKRNKLYEEAENLEVAKYTHFLDLHNAGVMKLLCNWESPEIAGLMFGYPIENTISRIKNS